MCGRYTLAAPDPAQVRARFPVGESVEIRQRFNVAPGDEVLAVTTDREGAPRGEELRWGLVPHWSQRPQSPLKMINARAETLNERPAFRDAFARFRCLILADGFYEWSRTETGRHAFHITRAGGEPFAFAGLWSRWRGEEGEVRSCAIITTTANHSVAALHDRMPVILDPAAEAAWLDKGTPRQVLSDLLRPLAESDTRIREVGQAVNDARYDGPGCLAAPLDPAPTLF